MNPKNPFSSKRLQIDKANTTIVAFLAAASFITVFSLMSCRALLNQRSYQARVIEKKQKSLDKLKDNVSAAKELVTSYQTFVSQPANIIEGSASGMGDRDGDNAQIVLDALPSIYDYPAVKSSLEKILTDRSYKIEGITGEDDEVNQSDPSKQTAQPVDMPFEVNLSTNFDSIQKLLDTFQLSIRPFHIDQLSLSGNDKELKVRIAAKTFYQSEKTLKITTEVVK